MELNVAQTRFGDAVQRRRRNDTAKGARHTVALVIGHDKEHVRRTLGRHDAGRPPRRRLRRSFLDHATEFWRRWRDLLSVDSGGGVGLTQCARHLLRGSGPRAGEKTRDGKRSQRQFPDTCC